MRLWRGGPLRRGHLRLTAHGVEVFQTRPLRSPLGPLTLPWSEIEAIRYVSLRATQHIIGFDLTHQGALSLGFAQPTTRRGPRWLTRRSIMIDARALSAEPRTVIDTLISAALSAGRSVRDCGGEYGVATAHRWVLSPAHTGRVIKQSHGADSR